jgi:hypothetical protein
MFLLLLFCFWFGQGQVSPTQNQSATNANQQSSPQQSPIIERGKTGETGESSQKDQAYATRWLEPLVVLNLALFAAVLIQAGIYWKQLREMRKTLAVLDRQAKTQETQSETMQGQLDAMERQEGVMRDSLAETRKSMRYAQSAYITVKAIDATKFSVGEKIEVTVIYSNSGNTPAYNVDTYSRGESREEPFSFIRDEIATGFQHGVHSKGILAPRDDMAQVFGTDIPLTIGALAGLRTKPYHAWGVIFYQDIFKRDRWTQFCYVYREKREWTGEKGHFEICADCNKTDDQK